MEMFWGIGSKPSVCHYLCYAWHVCRKAADACGIVALHHFLSEKEVSL